MSRLLFVTIVAAALALVAAATAGECGDFFCNQKHVVSVVQNHAQAVVVAPVVYPHILYQAGYAIEQEARDEKVAKRAAYLAIREFTAQQQKAVSQARATPPALPDAAPYAGENIVAEKCGKCHSGAAPKAGLTIDGVTPMPCASVLESLRQIKDDEMPKGGSLSPEEKGLLMEALLALEAK